MLRILSCILVISLVLILGGVVGYRLAPKNLSQDYSGRVVLLTENGPQPYVPQAKKSFVPQSGFVPDEKTAVTIGKAVLEPVYKNIEQQEPFQASLDGDMWVIKGSLPEGVLGGVGEVRIDKRTGRILHMIHGK